MRPILLLTVLALAFSLPALGDTSQPATDPVSPSTPTTHAELEAEPAISTVTSACPSAADTGLFTTASFAECLGPCFGAGGLCPERQFCTNLGCSEGCCWYECW